MWSSPATPWARASVALTGNHYGDLRTIEKAYGLPLLGAASNSANGDLSSLFGLRSASGVRPRDRRDRNCDGDHSRRHEDRDGGESADRVHQKVNRGRRQRKS